MECSSLERGDATYKPFTTPSPCLCHPSPVGVGGGEHASQWLVTWHALPPTATKNTMPSPPPTLPFSWSVDLKPDRQHELLHEGTFARNRNSGWLLGRADDSWKNPLRRDEEQDSPLTSCPVPNEASLLGCACKGRQAWRHGGSLLQAQTWAGG